MSVFRMLASADLHFNKRSRFDECVRVHKFVSDLAREAKVHATLLAGDAYESESTPEEREAFGDFLIPTAEQGPVVFSRGNHDCELDVDIMARLKTRHPVIVESGAGVHYVAGAAIATVAWPQRSTLLAAAGTIEGTELLLREALQQVFRGLGDELAKHDGPRIGLGHLMIDGSIASTGQPLLGLPINVGLADLALFQAHLGIVGHIHKRQKFDVFGVPWMYPGAPYRTAHGQSEPKSVVLAEFDGQRLVSLEEIETPATPMLDIESTWINGLSWDGMRGLADIRDVVGAEVRWSYRVPAEYREAAAASAREWADKLLADGAKSVKIEPETIVETRARAPEVAAASSIGDKLEAHWKSIGFDPDDRREALLLKASILEEEEARRAS
jgi:DNA repair exonuclease SbcCD nuclease subunit